MNSINIWGFFSRRKNRCTLTVTSFFSSPVSVCRNCHRSRCKWCFLTNCVLVLLLFDSVCYGSDQLPSDLCHWSHWFWLNKDFFGSCLLDAVNVSSFFWISDEAGKGNKYIKYIYSSTGGQFWHWLYFLHCTSSPLCILCTTTLK